VQEAPRDASQDEELTIIGFTTTTSLQEALAKEI
jgi:hypothetical protein